MNSDKLATIENDFDSSLDPEEINEEIFNNIFTTESVINRKTKRSKLIQCAPHLFHARLALVLPVILKGKKGFA